jgi:hypothetical protein
MLPLIIYVGEFLVLKLRIFNRDVLPAPDYPIMAKISPGFATPVIPFMIVFSPMIIFFLFDAKGILHFTL